MKKNEILAIIFGLIAIAFSVIIFWEYTYPGTFNKGFMYLSEVVILITIIGLVALVASSEGKKSEEESVDLSERNKREIRYITAIVRDYPKEDFLLGKGAIWNLMKIIIDIDPDALTKMHFNIRVASFLKDKMEMILKSDTNEPLQGIKDILEDADVAEVNGDFGTNYALLGLQNTVKDLCYQVIMEAAQKEYAFQCTNSMAERVDTYLDDIEKVEIFRLLNLKSTLLSLTKQFEVIS